MNEDRVTRIRAALESAFHPETLQIEDQSHLHEGHAGAREGKGHFKIDIVADAFAGKAPLQQHRLIYAALGAMMESDIHALTIIATAPRQNG